MASFFRGPFQSTPFQQAIEKATDGNQPSEDWGLIMRICDHVVMHEDSAKEAVKIIRKRLQINPVTSGWRTIGLTLTLLEALTKNCGKSFHLQIAQKDFLKDFRGVLAPKNSPPAAIQEKVLGMIQIWALAFRDDPELIVVGQFYEECKQQGLEFPPAEPENIIKAAVPATGTIERPAPVARSMSQPASATMPRQDRSASDISSHQTIREPTVLKQMTPEQIAKLRSELDVVQTNAQVFGEMLVILQPAEEHPQDLDLLLELHKTCIQMQARIIDLLSQVAIDEITVDLLRYNDEFNNVLKTFESYMLERERRVGPPSMPTLNQTASPLRTGAAFSQSTPTKTSSNQDSQPALIKFDDESTTLPATLQNMHINAIASDATPKTTQTQATASVTTRPASNNHDHEQDVKEVEQWLNISSSTNTDNKTHQEDVTTHAFNNFLEKRASTIRDEPISEQHHGATTYLTRTHTTPFLCLILFFASVESDTDKQILFSRMPVKIYHDEDTDITIVQSKVVSFIGYGNQGRAQALNLRDSGVNNIVIGNIDDDYAKQAREDGFSPVSIEEAARQGDILMLLIPDEDQQTVWNEKIRGNIKPNSTLVVASGYNVAFNLLTIPDDMDVVMVAPRMIGAGVRDRYVQHIPYPCFVSVEKDPSGTALATCLSIASAIGATRGNGAVGSSCREEAGIDLFAEQALWPEIMAIFREGFNVLREAGFSEEAILFDMYLSKEPAEIFERAADEGFVKQLKYHSRTSQYGQLSTMNRHDGKDIREKFHHILHDNILSGKFAEKWSNTKWAAEELAKEWKEVENAPIVQADERMDTENIFSKDNIERISLGLGISIFLLIIFLLYGKIHVVFFVLLLVLSYKFTDYYTLKLNNPEKYFTCWPNLAVFFDTTKIVKEEILRKRHANCVYVKRNPWVYLMISQRLDDALDKFCGLCLRDHIYPWLSTITHDDSLVLEAKLIFRFLLGTVIRRLHNVDLNAFITERLLPLIFQTCDRYIHIRETHSFNDSTEFVRKMYKVDLHIVMHNRQSELNYLKRLVISLMPIIAPKLIYNCKAARHFLCELLACQILIDGIDAVCQPNTLNRLFYLYFTNAIQRRQGNSKPKPPTESNAAVEILSHFCATNGSLHKNKLAIDFTDVMYEKELMSKFSIVLDRHGSLGLLSIYLTLTDILNEIPTATDVLVRRKIYDRLKRIDERYLDPAKPDTYIIISNPYNEQDTLTDELKHFIYHTLEPHIGDENQLDAVKKPFDIQQTFTLLSKFHCKIYELIEEKYQRNFLSSDEHFYNICGQQMNSPNYGNIKHSFEDIASDFVHIEEIRTTVDSAQQLPRSSCYTTTSYQEENQKQ
ncbi:unnamed protein product [Rotaria magnacalcarata]